MITFNEFIEHKRLENAVTECAHIMAELDINPYEYIYESLKKVDPVLAEGWWDGVKDMAGKAWTAAKQVGKSMWDGGGLKHGLQQAGDTLSGPDAKFAAADRALTDLSRILQRPEFKDFQFTSSKGGKQNLAGYIEQILKDLRDSRNQMPKMTNAQVKQDYATKGQVKAQNAPGQPQQPEAEGQQKQAREKFGYQPAASAGAANPAMNVAS